MNVGFIEKVTTFSAAFVFVFAASSCEERRRDDLEKEEERKKDRETATYKMYTSALVRVFTPQEETVQRHLPF